MSGPRRRRRQPCWCNGSVSVLMPRAGYTHPPAAESRLLSALLARMDRGCRIAAIEGNIPGHAFGVESCKLVELHMNAAHPGQAITVVEAQGGIGLHFCRHGRCGE